MQFFLNRTPQHFGGNISQDLAFSASVFPAHFGSIRLPLGFTTNDPHNHFAAFRKSSVLQFAIRVELKNQFSYSSLHF